MKLLSRRFGSVSAYRVAGAWAAAAIVLAAALAASPAPALTISGRILKGEERTPVANQAVQIHVVRGQEELPGGTARTDAQGRFRFPDVKSDAGLHYYLATEYQGAFYTEGPLAAEGESHPHDIVVYEVGSDIASVRVKNQHIIVDRKDDGLHVTEVLIFENTARTAFLGVGPDHAENAGMRIGLPASVKAFQVGMGGDDATTTLKGRDLSSTRPIPPGMRPFSFSYHIPLSGRIDFSHRFYYPTETFVIMFDDPRLTVESKQLQSSGTREQGGKTYTMYTGTNFSVGQEATIQLRGASFWGNPALYPWLAAPLVIAGVLYLALRRGRRAQAAAGAAPKVVPMPVPAAEPHAAHAPAVPAAAPPAGGGGEEFAQVYLYLISALDQGNARGELPTDASSLIRRNLKRKLEVVLSDGAARAKH